MSMRLWTRVSRLGMGLAVGCFDPGKGIVSFTGDKATNQLSAAPSQQNLQLTIRRIFVFFYLRSSLLQHQ
jgi:hypothetical protein